MKNLLIFILTLFIMTSCGQKVEELAGASQDTTIPLALVDEATINTGETITVDVSLNDSDAGDNLDPTSVVLGVSVGGSCEFDTAPPLVRFKPENGFRGNGSCGYTICDESANCSQAILQVTVLDRNIPTVGTDFASTAMNASSTPIDTSINDTDDEGSLDFDSLAILGTPASVGGSCAISPYSPFVTFTPSSNFAGTGSCEYRICDTAKNPNCATGKIEVSVLDTTPPKTMNDTFATGNTPVSFNPITNDTDLGVGIDPNSITTTFSAGGTCSVSAAPNLEFTPNSGFVGAGSCGYQICDLSGNCSSGTVIINVSDTGSPVANTDEVTTRSGTPSNPFNVASNDIDPENQLLLTSVTIPASPAPVGGTCMVTTSPNIQFTPASGFSGPGSCSYEICDTASNCSIGTLNVMVQDRTAPTVVNDSLIATSDGAPVTINVATNDSDAEGNLDTSSVVLSFSVGGSCSFDTASPNVQFTADVGYIGQATCGYLICDTSNNCSSGLIQATVNDIVQPDANDDFASTVTDTATPPLNVTLNDTDPERNFDLSTVSILATPSSVGGTCSVTTSPDVVFTPTTGFTGDASCPYEICDNANNCYQAIINIRVNDTTFPLAINDSASTPSNTPVSIDVSTNDSDAQGNLDVTSVTLGFAIGGACSLDPVSPNVKFIPNAGFIGTGSCGYQICDTSSNCASAVINIDIEDAQAPTAVADITQTDSGQISAAFDVSGNDTDPENNLDLSSVTIPASPAPVGGACTVLTSPLLNFTPNAGFVGNGSCSYEICDRAGNCDIGSVSIAVIDKTEPTAVDDNISMATTDANVTHNVLANDSDPEGSLDNSSLTITASSGGVCVALSPNIEFTPDAGKTGSASCGYRICDLESNCTTANLFITISDNQAPVASNDQFSTPSGSTSDPLNVAANDSDSENQLDLGSVTILSAPASVGGTCAIAIASPLVIFTPNAGFTGTGSCHYQICDTTSNCASAQISVTVEDKTSPSVLTDFVSMSTADPNVTADVLANDSDPEGNLNASSLTIQFAVGGSCSVVSGQVQFVPNSGFTGQASCGYRVCDTANNCSDSTLNINVGDGTIPIVNNDSATTNSGTATGFINVAANDADPENKLDVTSVTVLATPPAVGGTCTSTNPPFVVFTPNAGFSGAGSCEYRICDLDGNCSEATINVTVLDKTPPVVVNDTTSTDQNTPAAAIDVSANDSDVEDNLDTASVTITSEDNGTCSVTSPSITYTPTTDFVGTGKCHYQICDTASNCAAGELVVSVSDITRPSVTINQSSSQSDPTNIAPVIFTVVFDEPIDAATFTVSDINDSASTLGGGVYSIVNAGNDQDFTVFIHGSNGVGSIELSLDANAVSDKSGQLSFASTSTDNQVTFDSIGPSGAQINAWTWTLSSPDIGSYSQDGTPVVALSGANSEENALIDLFDDSTCLSQQDSQKTITSGSVNFSAINYATDGSEDGLKTFYVRVTDSIGNPSPCTPINLSYTLDNTKPNVTINQLASQIDPTNVQPIVFDVIFSEAIDPSTFDASDIVQNGTITTVTWQVLPSSDNISFEITASGISSDGTLEPSILVDTISDLAGNTNAASTSNDNVVEVDTTPPTVNITSAPTITTNNDQTWPVSGVCTEPGELVEVTLEPNQIPGNILPLDAPITCTAAGTWSATIDTRSLSTDGTYTLQAIHKDTLNQSATTTAPVVRQATCTILPDAVTDLLAANITQQTVDLIWSIPADNGDAIVDYRIEYRPVETTSDWIEFPDGVSLLNITTVSSLNPATLYEFRVRALNSANCSADLSNITASTTKPNHAFFDPFDYELVNLAGATKTRVAALDDGTEVRLYNNTADYYSDTVAQIFNLEGGDVEIFDSVKGMILYSEKPIYASGKLRRTNNGLNSSSDGNPSWVSPLWAEKTLLGNQVRDGSFPATVDIYNVEAGTNITLFEGNTIIDSATNVAADTIVTFSIPDDPNATSINLNGAAVLERSFKIEANGFVMATSYMSGNGGVLDDMPFLPSSRKLLGVPSRAGFLGTGSNTPVNLTLYHTDGTVQTNRINNACVDTGQPLSLVAGSALSIMPFRFETCRTSQTHWQLYLPEVVYVDADQDVAGNNVADANGGNAAPFVPISLMKRRYIVPTRTAYVVFASTRPAVINQIDAAGSVVATHTLSRTGDGPNDDFTFHPLTPYRIRIGVVEPGTRFEGVGPTDLYVGWYQPAVSDPFGNDNGYTRDDETVLYGY